MDDISNVGDTSTPSVMHISYISLSTTVLLGKKFTPFGRI